MGKSEQFVRLKAESTYIKGVSLISNVYSNVPMYPHNNRVTKKTCQLVIFQRNNTAKFTKICIQPNSRTASQNLKSDFDYF